MNFIIHQMMQLEHINITNCHLAIKSFTGPTINQRDLSRQIKASLRQHFQDIFLPSAIEDRRRNRHAVGNIYS